MSSRTTTGPPIAAGEAPLRSGLDHETNPELLAVHRPTWNRFREGTPIFRRDISDKDDVYYSTSHANDLGACQDREALPDHRVTEDTEVVQYVGNVAALRPLPLEWN